MTTVSDENLIFAYEIDEALEEGNAERLYRYAQKLKKQGEDEFAHSLYLAAKRADKVAHEEYWGHDQLIGN